MNQILFTGNNEIYKKTINNRKKIKIFKLLLSVSVLSIAFFISSFLYFSYLRNKDEKFSKSLLNSFNIEQIYLSNTNYTTVTLNKNTEYTVIGIIDIPKINIKYPILSNTNDELLKISACRFFGPYPNEIGNLCIAAHNYDDNRFFSNLHKLVVGDSINIYDSNHKHITYYVYDKFEISYNDATYCINQNTRGKREITLITCNNLNKNRLVIKAKE